MKTARQCANTGHGLEWRTVPKSTRLGVLVEQCPACGGIWLNSFEPIKLESEEAREAPQANEELLRRFKKVKKIENMISPGCDDTLEPLLVSNVPGSLLIGSSESCDGFWFNIVYRDQDPGHLLGKSLVDIYSYEERQEIKNELTAPFEKMVEAPVMNPYDSPDKVGAYEEEERARSIIRTVKASCLFILDMMLGLGEEEALVHTKKIPAPDKARETKLVQEELAGLKSEGWQPVIVSTMLVADRARLILEDQGISSQIDFSYWVKEKGHLARPSVTLLVAAKDLGRAKVLLSRALKT